MQTENNNIISEQFVDDMAKQIYNTTKILYIFDEEDRQRIMKQLVKDFLKPYTKIENNVITKESSRS